MNKRTEDTLNEFCHFVNLTVPAAVDCDRFYGLILTAFETGDHHIPDEAWREAFERRPSHVRVGSSQMHETIREWDGQFQFGIELLTKLQATSKTSSLQ